MFFNYKSVDDEGNEREGSIDAVNIDVAISSLQRRGLVISSIVPEEKSGSSILSIEFTLFEGVSNKDLVILSRQIATLFEAQVSALRVFRLLASESQKPLIQRTLTSIADDIQGGSTISKAMSKHPKIFSNFYVNMVFSGEESGKINESFLFLADHLDRMYEVTSKARNALIYPAFVITVFIGVMILMLTLVIPKLSAILIESGQELPFYTRVVINISDFFVVYGAILFIFLAVLVFFGWRYSKTDAGEYFFDSFKLSIPYIGNLYRQLYFARIAETLHTMLSSGVPLVRAIEITETVIGNAVYEEILNETLDAIKGGSSVSDAFSQHPEIPGLMVAMVKVGEETGQLGTILKSLAKFYRREVTNAVDSLVTLIEPALIILLAGGVGMLLASILIPIYNISSAI